MGLISNYSWNRDAETFHRCSNWLWTNSENVIKQEIKIVKQQASTLIEDLKYAGKLHIGLKVLHSFIVDVLGRHTPAAKIFGSKSEEE